VIRKIEDQLYPRLALLLKLRVRRSLSTREFRAVDIALLKAKNFLRGVKRRDVVIRYTSLYEID
jgi:hypothetical protein